MRIYFSKLLGNHYNIEQKMFVLDWMLKTGVPFSEYTSRWVKDGVNKCLFDYSANDHSHQHSIPINNWEYSWWFDAIFSRAIYKDVPVPVQKWRKSEKIFPNKFRVLKMFKNMPAKYYEEHKHLSWLILGIFNLKGDLLNKNFHHKDFTERTEPKIIWIKVFATGGGWVVQYGFSFKEFNYENGWQKEFLQKHNQSLWEFFGETLDHLKKIKL